MTRTDYRLFAALALSTLLHLLAVVPGLLPQAASPPPPPPPIQAELRPPPPVATVAPPPPLTLPEPVPQAAAPISKPLPAARRPPSAPQTWTQAVRQQLQKLDAAGQFYPAEAIARGLEGEVQVLLVIDENGQVVATRLEQGSGHAILDEPALRAARSLKSLPADAPRQTVLPIRFRLK